MYQPGKFGPKRVPRDPFRPNLCTFLFIHCRSRAKMGQNGSKWRLDDSKWIKRGPKGSKCGQKRVNLCQNALNWVPSGLKWHQYELKRVKTGSKGVQRGPTRPKVVKMASKWPFPGQICLSLHRRGPTQHSKMGGTGTATAQRRVF